MKSHKHKRVSTLFLLYLLALATSAPLNVQNLITSQGIKIFGAASADVIGYSIDRAGDFNGDGVADIILGTGYANGMAGRVYVIFGKSSGLSNIDLASL